MGLSLKHRFVVGAILLVLLSSLAVLGTHIVNKFKKPPSQKVDQPVSFEESHPSLFVAYLDYNPKTQKVTQLSTKKVNADIPGLSTNQPPSSPDEFVYKVEVISEKNEPLQKGWTSIPKEIASTPDGLLRFRVYVVYHPGALVQASLSDNKVIWTGKIQ